MSSLCDTACGGAATLPTAYDDNCAPERRRSGASYFVLITCDTVLDITDDTAVAAAIVAGDVAISPKGKLEKNGTDQEVIDDAYGCGQKIIGGLTTNYTFTTYNSAGCESVDDYTYWNSIFSNYQSFRMIPVDCCGFLHYNATDNATANPGFEFSITSFPDFVSGEADLGQWEIGFAIDHIDPIDVYYDAVQTPLVLAELGISV